MRISIEVRLTNVYAENAFEPSREETKCMLLRMRRVWEAVTGACCGEARMGSMSVFPMIARSMTTVANMAVFRTCQRTGNVTRRVSGVRKASSSEGSISDNLFLCHLSNRVPVNLSKCARTSANLNESFMFSIE